jgi:tetratricopeptide (TPR) repeat protein
MMFRAIALVAVMFAALFLGSPAHAAWHKAESDRFVIYANDREQDIRRFAENLERYHSALAYLTGRNIDIPSPSNRVEIFVVGSGREISRLAGARNIGGFYIPRAAGSRAFVQEIRFKNGYPDFSTIVLLHEYAHHFLMSSSRFAMPRWMNEGAAEFFAAATFNRDGSLMIGRAAQHRGYELSRPGLPTVWELLEAGPYKRGDRGNRNGFYGRSWLLYHYLTFSSERAGQLGQYQRNLFEGMPSLAAGEAAFGDLGDLESELKSYLRGRFMTIQLDADKVPYSEIAIRPLTDGEAAIMEVRMLSQRGVNSEEAAELVLEAREIAARHPGDPGVLSVLAEAEYDAGNDDAAIAAADAAIAINPALTNPYVQKGYALFRKAREAEDKDAAYVAAMVPFEQLNALENDHPLPLMYYYRSFTSRGIAPPENAKLALERAAQLAPFDQQLWVNVAIMQAAEGKITLARDSLRPVATNSHGGRTASAASRLDELLAQVPDGEKLNLFSQFNNDIAASEEGDDSDE